MQKTFSYKNNVINSVSVLSKSSQDYLTRKYQCYLNYRKSSCMTPFCREIVALRLKSHLLCPRSRTVPFWPAGAIGKPELDLWQWSAYWMLLGQLFLVFSICIRDIYCRLPVLSCLLNWEQGNTCSCGPLAVDKDSHQLSWFYPESSTVLSHGWVSLSRVLAD